MFIEKNLINSLVLMKKLESLFIYDDQMLDTLIQASSAYDVEFSTVYNEDYLLQSTQVSLLPVTNAFVIQRQLSDFLNDKTIGFRQGACEKLIPQITQTPNIVSIKFFLLIISEQFAQLDDENKLKVFHQLCSFWKDHADHQVSPYFGQLMVHTLLNMIRQLDVTDYVMQVLIQICYAI